MDGKVGLEISISMDVKNLGTWFWSMPIMVILFSLYVF